MKTSALVLVALVTALAGPATAQSSWTWSGSNGASGGGTRDCSTTDGTRNCTGTRTTAGGYGRTYNTETHSTATLGARTVTGSRTGPDGQTTGFTRTWTR